MWLCRNRTHAMAFAAALAVSSTRAPRAHADIDLGTAANYAVLVEPGAENVSLNNSTYYGTVGIGPGILNAVTLGITGFIKEISPGDPTTGQLQFADPGEFVDNPGNIQGGVVRNQPQVTTAINTVNALSATVAAETGTSLTIVGGGQVVNASQGTLDGSGNRIFTVAGNDFNNNATGFTVRGASTDFVVININNGTRNEDLGGPILLSGGITPDHVLFNFTGPGGLLGLGGNVGGPTQDNGIFLAPNMAININNVLNNITIEGRLFGGQAGADFDSSVTLIQAGVPEPSTTALAFVMALAGLGYARFRRGKGNATPAA